MSQINSLNKQIKKTCIVKFDIDMLNFASRKGAIDVFYQPKGMDVDTYADVEMITKKLYENKEFNDFFDLLDNRSSMVLTFKRTLSELADKYWKYASEYGFHFGWDELDDHREEATMGFTRDMRYNEEERTYTLTMNIYPSKEHLILMDILAKKFGFKHLQLNKSIFDGVEGPFILMLYFLTCWVLKEQRRFTKPIVEFYTIYSRKVREIMSCKIFGEQSHYDDLPLYCETALKANLITPMMTNWYELVYSSSYRLGLDYGVMMLMYVARSAYISTGGAE